MKYKNKLKQCIDKNKTLKFSKLSGKGIDVEKEIELLYNINSVLSLFLIIVKLNIIKEISFSINFWKLNNKLKNKTLIKDNLSEPEIIVMDLLLSYDELNDDYMAKNKLLNAIFNQNGDEKWKTLYWNSSFALLSLYLL